MHDPGAFAQTFFFCVDFTTRDTFFNDQAGSFFVATDTSCNLYMCVPSLVTAPSHFSRLVAETEDARALQCSMCREGTSLP
jgi:hypothetical protein